MSALVCVRPDIASQEELRQFDLGLRGPKWPVDLLGNSQGLPEVINGRFKLSERCSKYPRPVVAATDYSAAHPKHDDMVHARSEELGEQSLKITVSSACGRSTEKGDASQPIDITRQFRPVGAKRPPSQLIRLLLAARLRQRSSS
jgi:hypothetical protein